MSPTVAQSLVCWIQKLPSYKYKHKHFCQILSLKLFAFLEIKKRKKKKDNSFWVGFEEMDKERQMREGKYAADICSIREAEARIRPFILKTPLLTSHSLDALSRKRLFFKCELFQKGWEVFFNTTLW